jgi:hypothetical protein
MHQVGCLGNNDASAVVQTKAMRSRSAIRFIVALITRLSGHLEKVGGSSAEIESVLPSLAQDMLWILPATAAAQLRSTAETGRFP